MPEQKSLTRMSRIDREVELVKKAWARKVERARRLYGYILDAAQIDDEGNYPPEWENERFLKQRLQVAKDARKSKRYSPVYIDHVVRMVENADKLAAIERSGAPVQLNIGTINVVAPPKYEEQPIDVEEVKK